MSLERRPRSRVRPPVRPAAVAALTCAAVLAIGGCSRDTSEEGRSPFATGNVSVAPQVEGRAPVPTPVPPPLPPEQTPTAPAP